MDSNAEFIHFDTFHLWKSKMGSKTSKDEREQISGRSVGGLIQKHLKSARHSTISSESDEIMDGF